MAGTTYIIDFTDSNLPGKESFTIAPGTFDGPSQTDSSKKHTSVNLFGQGYLRYGEKANENFLHLLENFASYEPPVNPTVGQLWFDAASNVLKLYDINQTWVQVGSQAPINYNASRKDDDEFCVDNDVTSIFYVGAEIKVGTTIFTIAESAYNNTQNKTCITVTPSGLPNDLSDLQVVSPPQPSESTPGQLWFNSNSGTLYVFNGTDWIQILTELTGGGGGGGGPVPAHTHDANDINAGTLSGSRGVTAGSNNSSFITYSGTVNVAGQFNGGSTDPSATTRLNYNGNFHATEFFGKLDSSNLTGTVSGARGVTAGTNTSSFVVYNGTTPTDGQFYGGTTNPSATTRLNYNGHFHATKFVGDGSGLTGLPSGGGATLSTVQPSVIYYLGLSSTDTGTWTDARVDPLNLFYTSGNQTLYATNFNTASDEKLKKNVKTIENALNIIQHIRGVEFEWKQSGEKSYGVIAQEIEKILPELVKEVEDQKTVNYIAMIGILIQAINEMNTKYEELKQQVERFLNSK